MMKRSFIHWFFRPPLHSPTAAAVNGFLAGLIVGFLSGYIGLMLLTAVAGALLGLAAYMLFGPGALVRR